MYINPFWAGVLATIVVELIAVIVYGAVAITKKDGGNNESKN